MRSGQRIGVTEKRMGKEKEEQEGKRRTDWKGQTERDRLKRTGRKRLARRARQAPNGTRYRSKYFRWIFQHQDQGFQKTSRRVPAFIGHPDILSVYKCMLCSALFFYIVDYKIIINHDWSLRPVFSGQKEHCSFSNSCVTANCKTIARLCLLLLRAVLSSGIQSHMFHTSVTRFGS